MINHDIKSFFPVERKNWNTTKRNICLLKEKRALEGRVFHDRAGSNVHVVRGCRLVAYIQCGVGVASGVIFAEYLSMKTRQTCTLRLSTLHMGRVASCTEKHRTKRPCSLRSTWLGPFQRFKPDFQPANSQTLTGLTRTGVCPNLPQFCRQHHTSILLPGSTRAKPRTRRFKRNHSEESLFESADHLKPDAGRLRADTSTWGSHPPSPR